jgi:tetratricopeptide (TPR) repeat protein
VGQYTHDGCLSILLVILVSCSTEADAQFEGAILLQAQGNHQQAVDEFTKVIGEDAEYAPAYLERGRSYIQLAQYHLAIADFTEYLDRSPDDSRGYVGRGEASLMAGNLVDALSNADEAIEVDSGSAQAFGIRGRVFEEQGDLK